MTRGIAQIDADLAREWSALIETIEMRLVPLLVVREQAGGTPHPSGGGFSHPGWRFVHSAILNAPGGVVPRRRLADLLLGAGYKRDTARKICERMVQAGVIARAADGSYSLAATDPHAATAPDITPDPIPPETDPGAVARPPSGEPIAAHGHPGEGTVSAPEGDAPESPPSATEAPALPLARASADSGSAGHDTIAEAMLRILADGPLLGLELDAALADQGHRGKPVAETRRALQAQGLILRDPTGGEWRLTGDP